MCFILVFGATDPAITVVELLQVRGIWSPRFITMEHSRMDTGCVHLATHLKWEVPGGEEMQEFPELLSGHATSVGIGAVTTPTGAQRVTQGAVSIRKTVLPGVAIPMLKIRRPNGRLIFNMEIAICR